MKFYQKLENMIPASLVLNIDQTLSKYALGLSQILAQKSTKHFNIKRSTYKQAAAATLDITLRNAFLPMKLFYGEKTAAHTKTL